MQYFWYRETESKLCVKMSANMYMSFFSHFIVSSMLVFYVSSITGQNTEGWNIKNRLKHEEPGGKVRLTLRCSQRSPRHCRTWMDFVVNKAVEKLSADVVNIFVNTLDVVLTYLQQHYAGLHNGAKCIFLVSSVYSPKYSCVSRQAGGECYIWKARRS